MFRGLNAVILDAKGRITVPTHYRALLMEEAQGELVITIDTEERCLLLYPFPTWQEIEEKLEKLPTFHPASRRIQRLLIGHATELQLDRQGRVLIPPLLREYAGLDHSAILVGQGKKFELWDENRWNRGRDAWMNEASDSGNGVPSELLSLSL